MRLFSGKIPTIAQEVVKSLSENGDVETAAPVEVQADIESVLKEYLRQERKVTDEAKNRMEIRGLTYGELGKMKGQVAKDLRLATGEDTLPYLVEQILEILFHSANVEEIFADDNVLRKKITTILRKHMDVEQELDKEVRGKIKNLEEGTAAFETEYGRVMEQIKRNKRLT
ncbi:MAG: DUF507 family protein [Myxococcota bacterium]|nr:DUF507 family protein [Myxococcota bacterium]